MRSSSLAVVLVLVVAHVAAAQPAAQDGLAAERQLAARIDNARMAETVRTLVGFGPRMYGTPSNHAAAAWLADAYRAAGLEVVVREDAPRDWYQPSSWKLTVAGAPLKTAWPQSGAPAGAGEAPLAVGAAPGAVCLLSEPPTPQGTAGCAAVIVDGRPSPSGWPMVGRLRGTWTVPVFAVSPGEMKSWRARVAAGERVAVAFALDARSGRDGARTVVATLAGRDRSKHILFCAHGDADSGGPGANDNGSGVAIILEIARAWAAAIKAGVLPQPAWDIRFATWGGEMSSTRQYAAALASDASQLQAVINYDQSGYGSEKDALYIEPDDVAINQPLVKTMREVMAAHLGAPGFPARGASVSSQGGTDSYVFQDRRAPSARQYPAVTLYTSAWERERAVPVTPGFPPLNWYEGEQPGMVTIDGDVFYHSVGDTPENTTDKEPANMGWCARVGLLTALRLLLQ